MLVAVDFVQIGDHARLSVEREIVIAGSEVGQSDVRPVRPVETLSGQVSVLLAATG